MQNVFTDRRAYVNALTYESKPATSASAKQSKQKDIDEYKTETGHSRISRRHTRQKYNFQQLEETYNDSRTSAPS